MPYPRNTTQWQIGDYVIHSADLKKKHMLMRVIGYTAEGLCKTVYEYPTTFSDHDSTMAGEFENDLMYLMNPADFNIELPVVMERPYWYRKRGYRSDNSTATQ